MVDLIEAGRPIMLDGKRGTSGAGRKADEAFSTLMSDVVDPRKNFIAAYARSVKNLDV